MIANIYIGNIATAGGTVNAITASYVPAPTVLVDKMILYFRAIGANTTTTPTFSPNSLTARTIVKQGGQALVAGDIPGSGAIMEVVYDSANTRWELLNPAVGGKNYKVYTALLTQTGTSAPVATVLENTLGGTPISSYNNVGNFSLTLSGLFTLNKTTVFIGSANDGDYGTQPYITSARVKDANEIVIDVDTASNDALLRTPIEIRVYP